MWDFMNHVVYGDDGTGIGGIEAASVPPLPGTEFVDEEASGIMDFMSHVIYGDDSLESAAVPRQSISGGQSSTVYQGFLRGDEPTSPMTVRSTHSTATLLQEEPLRGVGGRSHCVVCGHRQVTVHNTRRRSNSV
jgi:hypothetical protein